MKKILAFLMLFMVSPWLTWSSPWAIVVNYSGTIQLFDLSVSPPRAYGPFLSGYLGSSLAGGVAVTPDGHYALVCDFYNNRIYQIDVSNPKSPSFVGTIRCSPFYPEDIAISPDGKFAVVSDGAWNSTGTPERRIAFIDLSSFNLTLYSLSPGEGAEAVAIGNDSQTVIICDYMSNRIIYGKVNTTFTGLLSETALSTDTNPVNVTISPDGATALVACYSARCVDVFKISGSGVLSSGTNTRVSGFSNYPQSIAFSTDGTKAYVLCCGSRDYLSWLRVNGAGDVSMGYDGVTNLYSYSNTGNYGINVLAVSPRNDYAVAGCNVPGTGNSPTLIDLSNYQATTLAGSQNDGTGVATFNDNKMTLTIQSTSGGTTNPAPGSYTYDKNSVVSVQATADANCRFVNWTGDASGTSNPISITMTQDKTIKANFAPGYTLTVAAGTGGTTDPVPGTYTYNAGTVVSVTATPSSGYRFGGWSGDASGTTNPISITMNGNKTVTASFVRGYTLTVAAGTGGTTNPVPGTYTYDDGAVVSITATPSSGYRFGGWSGDASGTTNPISITMNGNKTVTASFVRRYNLTITAGSGGTTSPVPGTYTYDDGASVSVQAVPAAAYQFDSWTGDVTGSTNPVTIVISTNKAIQANFSRVVKPPLSLTGERLINRNVSMVENIVRLKWQANTANSGTISYRVYQITNGQATAIANVSAGTYEYLVRNLQATTAYQFGVTAMNSQGWESDMTLVTVQ